MHAASPVFFPFSDFTEHVFYFISLVLCAHAAVAPGFGNAASCTAWLDASDSICFGAGCKMQDHHLLWRKKRHIYFGRKRANYTPSPTTIPSKTI
jgi:hypothetical protein